MAQDTYEFKDESGLVVHVKHIHVPMQATITVDPGLSRNPKDRWKKEIYQQPSSEIYVEVPENCGLSIAEVYQAFTGEPAPKDYTPKSGGNRLKIGTVKGMFNQTDIINSLLESKLFTEATIDAVNNCCNSPTPAPLAHSVAKEA